MWGPQCHVHPACRARRAAKEAKEAPAQPAPEKVKVEVKKFVKIGRPGYKGKSVGGCGRAPQLAPVGVTLSLSHTDTAVHWPSLAHPPGTCPTFLT